MSNLLHEGHHTDIMATKPVPPRPTPRLYLATPLVTDHAQLATQLPALLGAADVAAVLLRLAPSDERGIIQHTKALAPPVQRAGAALLLDGHFQQVARGGADGANVSGIEAMQEAMPTLKPDRILGVGGLVTRHDAMTAGEAGADYVLFGEPDAKGERPSPEAICERLDWWAELFEPPCVGFAATLNEAHLFASAGADFVLVGDFIWQDSRGPQTALREAADALAQGFAASVAKTTIKEE